MGDRLARLRDWLGTGKPPRPRLLMVALVTQTVLVGLVALVGFLLLMVAFTDDSWGAVFLALFALSLLSYSVPALFLVACVARGLSWARWLYVLVSGVVVVMCLLYLPYLTSEWSTGSKAAWLTVWVGISLLCSLLGLVAGLHPSTARWFGAPAR